MPVIEFISTHEDWINFVRFFFMAVQDNDVFRRFVRCFQGKSCFNLLEFANLLITEKKKFMETDIGPRCRKRSGA